MTGNGVLRCTSKRLAGVQVHFREPGKGEENDEGGGLSVNRVQKLPTSLMAVVNRFNGHGCLSIAAPDRFPASGSLSPLLSRRAGAILR